MRVEVKMLLLRFSDFLAAVLLERLLFSGLSRK